MLMPKPCSGDFKTRVVLVIINTVGKNKPSKKCLIILRKEAFLSLFDVVRVPFDRMRHHRNRLLSIEK